MRLLSLILTLTIIITSKAQNLSVIGDFNKATYYSCSTLLSAKKISIRQLKTGETKLNKIKEFTPNLINDSQKNTVAFQKTLDYFIQSQAKNNNEVVFITINNPNKISTQRLIGNDKKIINLKEFISSSHLYIKTKNILLLAPSFIDLASIEPTSTSSITEFNVKIFVTGTTNYKLDSISLKLNDQTIALPRDCFSDWNANSGEFKVNYNLESIINPIGRDVNMHLVLIDNNGFTFTKDISGITIQKAYLNASFTDIGEVAPKTNNKYPFYAVSIESNINLSTVEIEYFDRNKQPYTNARMAKTAKVLPCDNNEKIVIIKPEQSPVSWTIHEPKNNSFDVYSSTISINEKHSLCGYHWEGYVKFRYPNSTIATELIKIKLPGFDTTDKIEFDLIECY